VNDPAKYGYEAAKPTEPVVYNNNAQAVQQYFNERAGTVSKGIDAETDKQLRATLTEGINNGESTSQLMDRIENVYGAATGYRSERIARTESQKALHFASQQAWKQSGVVKNYIWLTGGPDPCPICSQLDGTVKADPSDFPGGGNAHVNCECDVMPNTMMTPTSVATEALAAV
jgi:SPP1 gp7 family putative phage head morphogenesis protein